MTLYGHFCLGEVDAGTRRDAPKQNQHGTVARGDAVTPEPAGAVRACLEATEARVGARVWLRGARGGSLSPCERAAIRD